MAANGKKRKESAKKSPSPGNVLTTGQLITETAATIRILIKAAAAVLIIYFGVYKTVTVLAGKETGANILVSILGNFKTACSLSLVAGASGIFYGYRQKKLTERTIEQFAPFVKQYETSLDPTRESSGLTDRGRTPPEEEI